MRQPAPAPPTGWRPKPLTLRQKLDAALRALGLSEEMIEWQHDPPIQLRVWVPDRQDTEPPSRDPNYVTPMRKSDHREVTAKVDIPAIAKTKRMAGDHAEFVSAILAKEPGKPRQKAGKIQSRGFSKRAKS